MPRVIPNYSVLSPINGVGSLDGGKVLVSGILKSLDAI